MMSLVIGAVLAGNSTPVSCEDKTLPIRILSEKLKAFISQPEQIRAYGY